MKKRAIPLFCLMVFLLSACAPTGAGTMPTPILTKTPRPTLTPTPGPPLQLVLEEKDEEGMVWIRFVTDPSSSFIIEVLGIKEDEREVMVRIQSGSAFYTRWFKAGEKAGLEFPLWDESTVRFRLLVSEDGNIYVRKEEEPEWRVPSAYEPLQL